MTPRTRLLAVAMLVGVIAVSSALAAGRSSSFTVTSSLDGKKVLPLRIPWIAHAHHILGESQPPRHSRKQG